MLNKFWKNKYFALCLLIVWFFGYIPIVRAGALSETSVALGDMRPSNTTNFTVNFKPATTATLKRIYFYFVRASDNGNEPATQDLTNATFDSASGITYGNWGLDTSASSNGTLFLKFDDGQEIASGTSVSVTLASMHTAELGDCTVDEMIYDKCWVNIATYSDDGSTLVDSGGAEYQLEDTPSLVFTISGVTNNSTPNGITTTRTSTYDAIDFGQLNINEPVFMAHKIFASTTAPHGYNVMMKLDGFLQGLDPNNLISPFLPTNGGWNSPQDWESPEGNTNSDSGWVGANTSDGRIDQELSLTNIWSNGHGVGKFGPVSSTAHLIMSSNLLRDRAGTEAYVTYGIEVNENQTPDSYAGVIQYNITTTY